MFGRSKHLAGLEIRVRAVAPGLIGRTHTLYVVLPLPLHITRSCLSRQKTIGSGNAF